MVPREVKLRLPKEEFMVTKQKTMEGNQVIIIIIIIIIIVIIIIILIIIFIIFIIIDPHTSSLHSSITSVYNSTSLAVASLLAGIVLVNTVTYLHFTSSHHFFTSLPLFMPLAHFILLISCFAHHLLFSSYLIIMII